jgi:hypothetical protein
MTTQRELITISRQIGSMMEAGVDILRITRVLRAQTEDAQLLRAFDRLDHALRMGQGLSEAMENVPEIFSPFAVSLVRQGEARNDIAGAWLKLADFLQKEDEADYSRESGTARATAQAGSTPGAEGAPALVAPSTLLPVWVIDDLINRAQVAALRIFTLFAGLLLTLAAVWASVEAGFLERRWQNVVLCSVSALFIGGAGVWLRRRIDAERATEIEHRRTLETQAQQPAIAPTVEAGSTPGTNEAPAPPPEREATFD